MNLLLKTVFLAAVIVLVGCDTGERSSPESDVNRDVGNTELDAESHDAAPAAEQAVNSMATDEASQGESAMEQPDAMSQTDDSEDEPMEAEAVLAPTEGNSVTGSVRFMAVEDGVKVDGAITGLAPGSHGFHIHETGDCSAPDGTAAGGHYAPSGSPHGAPDAAAGQRHMGDLGNLEVDETGAAKFNFVDPVLVLGGDNSVIGKAVIVHAGQDDLSSQPSGAAGPRVACGVIKG